MIFCFPHQAKRKHHPRQRQKEKQPMRDANEPQYPTLDRLSSLVLNHWKQHQPKMVQHFQKEGRLQTELAATARRMSDQLYELTIIQKMPYREAWWIVVTENLHGEPDDDELSPSRSQSESPAATSE